MDEEESYGRTWHFIGERRLDTFVGNSWLNYKSSLYHFSDCILGDSALLAVIGLEPNGKSPGTFARIARDAASGNVFPIDYSRVVDDVLPCPYWLSRPLPKFHATVYAVLVSIPDLSF